MEHLVWIIPLALVLILVMWVMGTYNGLVSRRNEAKNSWSQIVKHYWPNEEKPCPIVRFLLFQKILKV